MSSRFRSVVEHVGIFLAAASVPAMILVSPPRAHAYTYNREAAAKYAHRYAANFDTSARNRAYKQFGKDCTNFTSQMLRAGGWSFDSHDEWTWWYSTNGALPDTNSHSWSVVLDLVNYARFSGGVYGAERSDGIKMLKKFNRYTPARKGDFYVYEWGDSDGFDHTALASGWGAYPSVYDSHYKMNYRQANGGRGDMISQHGSDRDWAPYNWGYLTESNLVRRRNSMIVWVGII